MSTLIIRVGPARAEWWRKTLQERLPELQCRLWDEPGDDAAVEYAAVWRHPPGGLLRFPKLKAIFSLGAGADHVLSDPQLPPGVPVIRTVSGELAQRMYEYVALHVLRVHRRLPDFEAQQTRREWRQIITPLAGECSVGVMGLGAIGHSVAQRLHALGFRVNGWARSAKTVAGVNCFHAAQWRDFLGETDILVCLLPLTAQTQGILNRATFAALPRGAYLINVGRGEHLIEDDLLLALQQEQLAGAVLDVFRQEPLPPAHPFWAHPKITVTPHTAGLIDPIIGGQVLARNIRRFRAGERLADIVDTDRGY